jgi:hypothetical protein
LQNRQADADLPEAQSQTSVLCFRTHEDALDFADHIVKEANWLASIYHFGRVLQNYREGNLGICATLRIGVEVCQYDLICLSIEGAAAYSDGHELRDGGRECHFDFSNPNWNQAGMFDGVAKFVNSPEGIIPSFVRLEPFKERADFRVQVLETSDPVRPMVGVGSKGKVSELGFSHAAGYASGVARLIQAGPQIVHCIENNAGKSPFERILSDF